MNNVIKVQLRGKYTQEGEGSSVKHFLVSPDCRLLRLTVKRSFKAPPMGTEVSVKGNLNFVGNTARLFVE